MEASVLIQQIRQRLAEWDFDPSSWVDTPTADWFDDPFEVEAADLENAPLEWVLEHG